MLKVNDDNSVNKFDLSGRPIADAMLSSEKIRWSLLPGNELTYSFINKDSQTLYLQQVTTNPEYKNTLPKTVTTLSTEIEEFISRILDNVFGSIIAVKFKSKNESVIFDENSNPVKTTDFGTLRFMYGEFSDKSILAQARFPANNSTYPGSGTLGGDVYLTNKNSKNYFYGSDFYATILHEISHALGLQHPFADAHEEIAGKELDPVSDNNSNTVMTYSSNGSTVYDAFFEGQSISLMPYDILALQYLYGAQEKNPGDTVYTFDEKLHYSVNGKPYYDFG